MRQKVSAESALPPTRLVATIRRVAGPIWSLVGIVAVLEVPRRKSGTPQRVSLVPVKVGDNVYLLSFGGVTEWARNLRAAGQCTLRRRRRAQEFKAIEVEGDERDRVIAKYLAGSDTVKKDFYRRPRPADHPTFRLEPLT